MRFYEKLEYIQKNRLTQRVTVSEIAIPPD